MFGQRGKAIVFPLAAANTNSVLSTPMFKPSVKMLRLEIHSLYPDNVAQELSADIDHCGQFSIELC